MPKNKFLYTLLFILFNYMMSDNINNATSESSFSEEAKAIQIIASYKEKLTDLSKNLSSHFRNNDAIVIVLDPSKADRHGGEGFAATSLLQSMLEKDRLHYARVDLSGGSKFTQIANEFIAGIKKFENEISQNKNIIIFLFHGSNPSPSSRKDLNTAFRYDVKNGYEDKNLYMINGNGPVLLNLTYVNYAKFISNVADYLNQNFTDKNFSFFTPACGINNSDSVFYPAASERNNRNQTLMSKIVENITISGQNNRFSISSFTGAKTYTMHPVDVKEFTTCTEKSDINSLTAALITRVFFHVDNLLQGVHVASTVCPELAGFTSKEVIEAVASEKRKAYINPHYYKEVPEAFQRDVSISREGNASIKISDMEPKVDTLKARKTEIYEDTKKEIQSTHSPKFIQKFSK